MSVPSIPKPWLRIKHHRLELQHLVLSRLSDHVWSNCNPSADLSSRLPNDCEVTADSTGPVYGTRCAELTQTWRGCVVLPRRLALSNPFQALEL